MLVWACASYILWPFESAFNSVFNIVVYFAAELKKRRRPKGRKNCGFFFISRTGELEGGQRAKRGNVRQRGNC